MHPEIISNKPGKCPKCGMALVLTSGAETFSQSKNKFETYKPLIIIIGLILLTTLSLALKSYTQNEFNLKQTMANFMAGFFLVFSGFKLLDLTGFAQSYASYDLLARIWTKYGFIYPFIELALGLCYLVRVQPLGLVNLATIIIMGFSGLGVLESLAKKRKFQCACLGTVIKVPLTNVTLIEDFSMAAMALAMLLV